MDKILAIDDEESVRQSYRMILSQHYHVSLAKGGQEALDFLEKNHADLILLDLTMPGMTGDEVLRRLGERGNVTPVIVVTASSSVNSAVEAMKLGAREYLQKPFDVHALLFNIERILKDERAKRELTAL